MNTLTTVSIREDVTVAHVMEDGSTIRTKCGKGTSSGVIVTASTLEAFAQSSGATVCIICQGAK